MPFELERNDDSLVIDFTNKSIKGYTKGQKGFLSQIKLLKEMKDNGL